MDSNYSFYYDFLLEKENSKILRNIYELGWFKFRIQGSALKWNGSLAILLKDKKSLELMELHESNAYFHIFKSETLIW